MSEVFWTQIGFQIRCQHFQGKLQTDYTSPFHRPLIMHIVMTLGGNIDIITCLSYNLTSMGKNAKQIVEKFPVPWWLGTKYYITQTNDNTVSWLIYVSPMTVLIQIFRLNRIDILIIKIRWFQVCVIFIIEIYIPGKNRYIETGPRPRCDKVMTPVFTLRYFYNRLWQHVSCAV